MNRLTFLCILGLFWTTLTQAQSIHQEQSEYYSALGIEANDYYKINQPQPVNHNSNKNCTLDKVVYGWHPYWMNGNEANYDWDLLSHFVYFSYEVNPSTGNANTTHSFATASSVTTALNNGKKVHLCVTLFSGHATFFNSATAQQNLINNLISLLQARGGHGVNIDFEGVSSSHRNALSNFIANLSTQMKAAIPGSELTIALFAVDWSNLFDIAVLKNHIDYFVIMGYDYYWKGSAYTGPNDPLYYFQPSSNGYDRNLSRSTTFYLAKGLPESQLVLGLPYYGREWASTSFNFNAATTAQGTPVIYSTLRNNSNGYYSTANHSYTNSGRSDRHTFYRGGNPIQSYINREQSMRERLDFINKRGLAGMGIWALGYDNGYSNYWNAIEDYMTNCYEDPCTGTIQDMGGQYRNYYDNEDYTYTIAPPGASSVSLTFSSFNLEANYDFLYLYDGIGTNAPLLGTFTGTSNPGTITATSGALTLRFTSDGGTQSPGYVATYVCDQDNLPPSTTITTPYWVTADFDAAFADTDNSGGSGIKYRFDQICYANGNSMRANPTRGYFKDLFDLPLQPEWSSYAGTWATTNGKLLQTDETVGNTILSVPVNQNVQNQYLYSWNAAIGGTGTNRRAGIHFMCDNASLPNRGNSYFIYFRVDNNKLQIYSVDNDVYTIQANLSVNVNLNQMYAYQVIYDKTTGKIEIYMDGVNVGEWTDPTPITTGGFVSIRTGNCTYTVENMDVFSSRVSLQRNIKVGSALNDDFKSQNSQPSTPAGKIKTLLMDNAGNFSALTQKNVNVDWTPPVLTTINDGTGTDLDVTASATTLSANWAGTTDSHSGITRYEYAVGVSPGTTSVVNWTATGTNTSMTNSNLSLVSGTTYYVSLRAVNGAGLTSNIVISDGITVVRDLLLSPKVLLSGCFNQSSGLMNDNLRAGNQLPLSHPYGGAPWNYTGSEMVSSTLFNITGNNAMIDWILVELRDATDPAVILSRQAAILQADGDIVAVDGLSPLMFTGLSPDTYHVAVHHRNHLGAVSAVPVALNATTAAAVDFRSIPTYGTNAQTIVSLGVSALWTGDADSNGSISATDRSDCWNSRNTTGYLLVDVNLDGVTNASDRSKIWNNRNQVAQLP